MKASISLRIKYVDWIPSGHKIIDVASNTLYLKDKHTIDPLVKTDNIKMVNQPLSIVQLTAYVTKGVRKGAQVVVQKESVYNKLLVTDLSKYETIVFGTRNKLAVSINKQFIKSLESFETYYTYIYELAGSKSSFISSCVDEESQCILVELIPKKDISSSFDCELTLDFGSMKAVVSKSFPYLYMLANAPIKLLENKKFCSITVSNHNIVIIL